jgi:phenylacetate-CoA ligase
MYSSSFYRSLPASLQTVVVTAMGAASRLIRGGRLFRRVLQQHHEEQWLSADELQSRQDRAVARTIRHAYERVPYYRDLMKKLGLRPEDITTASDLEKLPYLTKETVREEGHRFIREDLGRYDHVLSETSGTTGTPLKLVRSNYSLAYQNAVLWWVYSLAGLTPWDRRVTIRGDLIVPTDTRRPPYYRMNYAENQLLLSMMHMSPATMPHYFEAMKRYQPAFFETFPGAAHYVATQALKANADVRFRACIASSEPLYPRMRADIERAFSCEVYNYYGQAERVNLGTECEQHDGFHMIPTYGVVELAKPVEEAPPGLKEIVGTTLFNDAMPLIRYRTGDLTRRIEEPCPCGRQYMRIEPIDTRSGAMIIAPDGRRISYLQLTRVFGQLEEIKRSQIVQDEVEHFIVRIVDAPKLTGEQVEKMKRDIQQCVGFDLSIDVEHVKDIKREKSGKYRWFISKLEDDDEGTGGSSA